MKILVAVDGSATALRAIDHAIALAKCCPVHEFVVLNVQSPADSWELKSHLRQAEIDAMQVAKGGDALQAAQERLSAAGVHFEAEVVLGEVAETIVRYAAQHQCVGLILGNQGESMLAEVALGSVAHDVLRAATVPVTFVK